MGKISVVYWSQSGNTLAMADAIGRGITAGGAEAEVTNVSSCQVSDLDGEEVFALGCPAMGAEVLEESEMEPFVADLEGKVKGKKIALFGSYGWGGQSIAQVEEQLKECGYDIILDKIRLQYFPTQQQLDEITEKVAAAL